jgi:integrase
LELILISTWPLPKTRTQTLGPDSVRLRKNLLKKLETIVPTLASMDAPSGPLAEHLADWKAFLLGKGRGQRHAGEGHARVVKLMALAKADRLSDLTLTRLQAALAALRDDELSLRTVHHYTRLVKNFTKWAWRDGRTREDLLAHLQPPDHPESDRRRVRRALTVPELARLVEAAEAGSVRRQPSGLDRAMLYRITAGTGFRSEEMQSLTPESFDLDGDCPTITVAAADSKRRRRDGQPIQPTLAALLRPWLAERPQGQPIFPGDRWQILEALKADESAAGIEYKNEGGFADFHALRHNADSRIMPTETLGLWFFRLFPKVSGIAPREDDAA